MRKPAKKGSAAQIRAEARAMQRFHRAQQSRLTNGEVEDLRSALVDAIQWIEDRSSDESIILERLRRALRR